jgi:hypothetical protein
MRIPKNYSLTSPFSMAVVLFASICCGQSTGGPTRDAYKRIGEAKKLAQKGQFEKAETIIRLSMDDIALDGGNQHPAHVQLGTVLLWQGKYDDAYTELVESYKPRRPGGEALDMLVTIAGCHSNNEQFTERALSSFRLFLADHAIELKSSLAMVPDASAVSAKDAPSLAAVIYSLRPKVANDESLMLLNLVERDTPYGALVAYARGLSLHKLGRIKEGDDNLKFAAAHSKALAEKAIAAMSRGGKE